MDAVVASYYGGVSVASSPGSTASTTGASTSSSDSGDLRAGSKQGGSVGVGGHTTAGDRLSDATNFLEGVADVLENKTPRGTLRHLGDLATVWLYGNDRQIKQVAYREIIDHRSFYTITVRMIR